MLDARRVVAVCGPSGGRLPNHRALRTSLNRRDHCLRAGRSCGRTWVVGWHPNGASHRGAAQPCTTSSWVQSAKPSRPDNFK